MNINEMNESQKYLLISVIRNIIKRNLGGTTEAAERLARKLIYIMDN